MIGGGGDLPPLPLGLERLIGAAVAEPVLAGEAGATVLRLVAPDGSVGFLKHGSGRVAADVMDEFVRLRWLDGRLPCARVLHFAQEGDAAWLLTRGVAGRTGDQWLEESVDHLPMVVGAYAGFLRALHALPAVDCPFEAGAALRMVAARLNIAAGLVDIDDFDDDHAGWTAEQLWDKLVALTPPAGERVVTHGDFSLGNLLLDAAGEITGVIDVGRLGVADPYQDIAILWQNLGDFGDAAREQFLAAYGVDTPDQQRLAFHRCLDELF